MLGKATYTEYDWRQKETWSQRNVPIKKERSRSGRGGGGTKHPGRGLDRTAHGNRPEVVHDTKKTTKNKQTQQTQQERTKEKETNPTTKKTKREREIPGPDASTESASQEGRGQGPRGRGLFRESDWTLSIISISLLLNRLQSTKRRRADVTTLPDFFFYIETSWPFPKSTFWKDFDL